VATIYFEKSHFEQVVFLFLIECPLPRSISNFLLGGVKQLEPSITLHLHIAEKKGSYLNSLSPESNQELVKASLDLQLDPSRDLPTGHIKLSACMGVNFGALDYLQWLEFIEFQSRIVGIQHFFIYALDPGTRHFFQVMHFTPLFPYTINSQLCDSKACPLLIQQLRRTICPYCYLFACVVDCAKATEIPGSFIICTLLQATSDAIHERVWPLSLVDS
jgi:hypothetical protein